MTTEHTLADGSRVSVCWKRDRVLVYPAREPAENTRPGFVNTPQRTLLGSVDRNMRERVTAFHARAAEELGVKP